jgi:hypothetical protein
MSNFTNCFQSPEKKLPANIVVKNGDTFITVKIIQLEFCQNLKIIMIVAKSK